MPRGQHIDVPATEAAHFHDERSFVSLDGKLFLYGEDWTKQKLLCFVRDGFICQSCLQLIDIEYEIIDAHHIIRRSKGGSEDLSNLVTMHRRCHNSQHHEKQPQFSSGGKTE